MRLLADPVRLARLIVSLAVLSLATGAIAQTTIRVPRDQPTIQAAIDAAGANDRVLVSPGDYPETIDFKGKSIEVRSVGGPASTKIDAKSAGSTVTFKSLEGPNAQLIGFTITGGSASMGGGVFIQNARPTLTDLVITGNSSGVFGAGVYGDGGASPMMIDCAVTGNASQAHGGAIAILGPSTAQFINSVFSRNNGPIGGACYFAGSTVTVSGCSIADNTGSQGGGVYQNTGTTTIVNSILWNNIGGPILISTGGGTVNADYCDIQGGYAGTGNFSLDPRFVSTANGDYHLTAVSPCIDRGNDARSRRATDYDGNPRIASLRVDVGADEFYPHLYYTGAIRAGGTARVNIVGPAAAQTAWGASAMTLPAPLRLPGFSGFFYLAPPFVILPLGALPSTGVTGFNIAFPAAFPPSTFFTQALVADNNQSLLTPLNTVIVR